MQAARHHHRTSQNQQWKKKLLNNLSMWKRKHNIKLVNLKLAVCGQILACFKIEYCDTKNYKSGSFYSIQNIIEENRALK